MRKEEKTEVKVRQVPIMLEDGRRIVPKVFKNKDSSAPNLSADFQRDIEDFVGKSGERGGKEQRLHKADLLPVDRGDRGGDEQDKARSDKAETFGR